MSILRADAIRLDTVGTVRKFISVGAVLGGATAPTELDVGDSRGLDFDADAEQVRFSRRVPDDWDGVSDLFLDVIWSNDPGAALADTNTVIWDINFRSRATAETVGGGTVATGTATYTQSGAGTDGEQFETAITIDHDNVNQPLTAGDILHVTFDRDVTGDTYASGAIVLGWVLRYSSNTLQAT